MVARDIVAHNLHALSMRDDATVVELVTSRHAAADSMSTLDFHTHC